MVKTERTEKPTMIYKKKIHTKLKIEQQKPNKKIGWLGRSWRKNIFFCIKVFICHLFKQIYLSYYINGLSLYALPEKRI